MESESKQVKKKLDVLDILKEAVTIYVKNINFIIFTFLTSLPFFCVMVYFELVFQKTIVETPEIIYPLFLPFYDRNFAYHFGYSYSYSINITDQKKYYLNTNIAVRSFTSDYFPVLIQLVLIYLVPLHVLQLCSAVVTTDLTSKLRSEENKMSLKQMFLESLDISVIKGAFITSLYMLLLSTCFLIAFPWTEWKTERYKEIIKSGSVKPRPGVLRLMDEAKDAGKKLAVCSAATKSSVILCLDNLIGIERFQSLDCFLAGDDVKEKKPDPSIYLTASKKLGVSEKNCLVVEDSVIGLQAATKAGMSCVVSYTSSTADQDFKDAIAIYPDLSNIRLKDLELLLQNVVAAK